MRGESLLPRTSGHFLSNKVVFFIESCVGFLFISISWENILWAYFFKNIEIHIVYDKKNKQVNL